MKKSGTSSGTSSATKPDKKTPALRPSPLPSLPAIDEAATQRANQRILQTRADALAVEGQAANSALEQIEVLEFILAHEHYAVETNWVREVYPLKTLTPLPCVPVFVMGIVNIRGRLVSIIDLKRFFGLPDKGITDLNKIIVLQDGAMEFAVLADLVVGVHKILSVELQATAPALSDARLSYLKGVTAQRLIVLDGKQLLNDARIVVNEEVT